MDQVEVQQKQADRDSAARSAWFPVSHTIVLINPMKFAGECPNSDQPK